MEDTVHQLESRIVGTGVCKDFTSRWFFQDQHLIYMLLSLHCEA